MQRMPVTGDQHGPELPLSIDWLLELFSRMQWMPVTGDHLGLNGCQKLMPGPSPGLGQALGLNVYRLLLEHFSDMQWMPVTGDHLGLNGCQ
jgi:hypothetical protein